MLRGIVDQNEKTISCEAAIARRWIDAARRDADFA